MLEFLSELKRKLNIEKMACAKEGKAADKFGFLTLRMFGPNKVGFTWLV